MPDSHTTATADALVDLATEISIERTTGRLAAASQLLALINVADDLAKRAAKDGRADALLARELTRTARVLGELSDSLCDAVCEYGERHNPKDKIISEMQAATGAVAVAS